MCARQSCKSLHRLCLVSSVPGSVFLFSFFNIRNFSQFSAFQQIKAYDRAVLCPAALRAVVSTAGCNTSLLSSPSPANPEDQWQREISEKGEVACPTCSVITRKTVVGLKKHMDVCQKVRTCFIQSRAYGFWRGMEVGVCHS